MLDKYDLPQNLLTVIDQEKIDFSIKAKRANPTKSSLGIILFGTIWTAFTSIFVYAFLWPIFIGEEVHFSSNNVPTVVSTDNLEPIILPAIIIGFFVLIGIIRLGFGIYSIFKKGGYFIGTPLRLISFQNGNARSIDWEQFSGDIEINGDEIKGNIALQMRTGRMVSSKNSGSRYVPDTIFISGIPNVYEVEQFCRKRNESPRCKQTGYQKSFSCPALCKTLYSFSIPCSRTYCEIVVSFPNLLTVFT